MEAVMDDEAVAGSEYALGEWVPVALTEAGVVGLEVADAFDLPAGEPVVLALELQPVVEVADDSAGWQEVVASGRRYSITADGDNTEAVMALLKWAEDMGDRSVNMHGIVPGDFLDWAG